MPSRRPTSLLLTLFGVLFLTLPSSAIKFALQSHRYPPAKCIWNTAHTNALVIVTANVGPGSGQRVDVEIVDSSPQKNVYLHKRNINDETRLAVTAHADGEVGVCFKNHLDDVPAHEAATKSRIIDLDVDIGADAVDYNAIANQESLSGLETEMRKLEGIVKEMVEEMEFLKRRENDFKARMVLSTNVRVQNFAWFTIVALLALGAWQIMHLRSFFKRKYLID
ncbi:emp24/gp25L/p24 family/GOLD-domain-containing protein [Lactifluus volemus]|nr:emp24/gp25L/p24 family/GOLD-domain-containing protein [Lactifluus volemus]